MRACVRACVCVCGVHVCVCTRASVRACMRAYMRVRVRVCVCVCMCVCVCEKRERVCNSDVSDWCGKRQSHTVDCADGQSVKKKRKKEETAEGRREGKFRFVTLLFSRADSLHSYRM